MNRRRAVIAAAAAGALAAFIAWLRPWGDDAAGIMVIAGRYRWPADERHADADWNGAAR